MNARARALVLCPRAAPTYCQDQVAPLVAAAAGSGYIWKYMYTIPTDDVLRFLSTNFMPINLAGEATRAATEAAAVDGAIDVVLVEDTGSGLPNGIHYAPILGDGQVSGTQGVVKITVTAGAIESTEVVDRGAGYTYASVALADGATVGGIFGGIIGKLTGNSKDKTTEKK